MNREAKNNFELGVYIFGDTRRTADVAYDSTAQAIRTALETTGRSTAVRIVRPGRARDTADVTISAMPVGGGIALCCWTRVERYERIEDGWRFVRLIGATIH